MPHSKIKNMSGVPFVEHTRGSHIDHNTHLTAHGGEILEHSVGERKIREIRGF